MSEPESNPLLPGDQQSQSAAQEGAPEKLPPNAPPPPARQRRRLFWTAAALALLALAVVTGLCFWANSASCENLVRRRLMHRLESATGGRVEIATFHWRPFSLEAEAGGLILHGKEAAGEAPFAQVEDLKVQLSILGFWSPRVLLRSLVIRRPALHLIVYQDGSTNQPQPRTNKKSGKSALDTFFDLEAGHLAVEEASLWYENRAAAFDFQNRHAQLNFRSDDFSLLASFLPANSAAPESYRIETAARDLSFARSVPPAPHTKSAKNVSGFFQATLDLTRSAAYLRSLRITAHSTGVPDRVLEITGALEDFKRPRWRATTKGDLDLRLVDSLTGYTFTPEGLAHLDLVSAGEDGIFRTDGAVRTENASYIGTGVVATGVQLDARVHADPEQLVINNIVVRLRQGGEIDGNLTLAHWLPPVPGATTLQPTPPGKRNNRTPAPRPKPVNPADEITIPVDGKVEAGFKGVALDTLLAMFCDPPFQHLGFDTRVNGSSSALWVKGDVRTLAVQALLNLTPPAQAAPGNVPASGVIDATYDQRDGSVDVRKLDLQLPASLLQARGHLGAYPLASPSAIAVDLHTTNLGEFDTVLRDLDLPCKGKSGVTALPVAFGGQAEFHGSWSGSLVDPHLTGTVKAQQLSVDLAAFNPPATPAPTQPTRQLPRLFPGAGQPKAVTAPQTPQVVKFDSVEATGSYTGTRIVIDHAQIRQRQAVMAVDGSLTSTAPLAEAPDFDRNSLLHLHLRASQAGVEQILPLTGQNLPLTGIVDAQIAADGPLRALSGSGWIALSKATVYGEPVAQMRAQGSVSGQIVKIASLNLTGEAGKIAASGSYDLAAKRFQIDANAAAIDVARLHFLQAQGITAAGKLGFTLSGAGTVDDPRLQARATLTSLSYGDEPLGTLSLNAHTANRAVLYDLTTRLDAAELSAHGQTALQGDHLSQIRLDVSHFNIGALLKMAHVEGLSGTSELAGSLTLDGPLSRPEALHGEARLQELAAEISGVHLRSDGGLHAVLSNGRLQLDPLHVTGESTDMHLQGSLSLLEKEQRRLDFAASGAVNMELARSLDPDLTASGVSTFSVEAHGPLENPDLRGRIDFQNGALALEDLPNGLSQINGTLEFNQNRLEVKSLTALTGGGLLSLGGFISYQKGLFANLTATGKGVRIRYPQGVSSLADASLHLQGSRNSLLLSGDVLITRFAVNPDFDFTALANQTAAVQAFAPPDAPSNHIRLDVHFTSSPQLNFQNAYAKLAGDVDLHLRGTVASPSLLGRVSITEGSAILAGTRYDLQRGELTFNNPVRIQPTIDLNASAHVEDFDITLGLHGTLDRPTVTYRSDPPLPEADVVALLALGRTQNQQRLYTQQQLQSNPTTDALLGGALNATVSSRVQKLFGSGSVKVDPNYLGALGNSTSRIIVEEQLGRNLTLTYATNVNTTGQQLLQAEVAINRHVSLLVARDESGVFSMVLKATRRYR
jgi:translocation and assembly module TamB